MPRIRKPVAKVLAVALVFVGSLSHSASAKTITAMPGVPVIALTTWYFLSCTESGGVGSYSINVAPTQGTVTFADVSGPVPGCPAGSPSLPAVQAYYTWTGTTYGVTADYFELNYNLFGNVYGPYDINVILSCPSTPSDAAQGAVIDSRTMPDGTHMVTSSGSKRVVSRTSSKAVSPDDACTPPPPPVIASSLPDGMAGVAYGPAVLVSDGTPPYTISATGLPPGLSVDDEGNVSGTPAASDSGTYQVEVSVTDSAEQKAGPKTVPIYIAPEAVCNPSGDAKQSATASDGGTCTPLTLVTKTLPPAQAYSLSLPRDGQYVAHIVAVGGAGSYNIAVQGLPSGLVVDYTALPLGSVTGIFTIDGIDTKDVPDTYKLKATVTDSAGDSTGPVSLSLPTMCGPPPDGDDRDTFIAEYVAVGLRLYSGAPPFTGSKYQFPHCDDFTQSYPNFNVGTPHCSAEGPDALVQSDLPPGLLEWQYLIGTTRQINSAYRDPNVQKCSGSKKYPAAKNSQHEHGDAIDLATLSNKNTSDYELLDLTAILAGFNWTETYQPKKYPCQPNRGACVHADMRKTPSAFVNP